MSSGVSVTTVKPHHRQRNTGTVSDGSDSTASSCRSNSTRATLPETWIVMATSGAMVAPAGGGGAIP